MSDSKSSYGEPVEEPTPVDDVSVVPRRDSRMPRRPSATR
jgi:hypothetical protein